MFALVVAYTVATHSRETFLVMEISVYKIISQESSIIWRPKVFFCPPPSSSAVPVEPHLPLVMIALNIRNISLDAVVDKHCASQIESQICHL